MKINKLLLALVAGAMFASCSDDRSGEPVNSGEGVPAGRGYVSVSINMAPNTNGSRANDNFDDGLDNEYQVHSVAVLFFTGRENAATFYRAYDVTPPEFGANPPVNDQISAIKNITFPVDFTGTTESLWALAVINYKPIMTVTDNTTLKINGETFTGNISQFMDKTMSSLADITTTTNGFFMTNTPYSTAPGTGTVAPTGFVHLLAEVNKDGIQESPSLAAQHPAAKIYVERAMAKVTLTHTGTTVTDLSASTLPRVAELGWQVDNTEKTSYIVRNLMPITETKNPMGIPAWIGYTTAKQFGSFPTFDYRFVGNNKIADNMYRIYFGVDPNGDGVALTDDTKLNHLAADATTGFQTTFGGDHPQYCFENTFSASNMNYHNTTRVVLAVKFAGGTFFTRSVDRTTQYTFEQAASAMAHFVLFNSDVVKAWTEYFAAHSTTGSTATINDLVFNSTALTAKNNWMNLQFAYEGGRLKVTDIVIFNGEGQAEANKVSLPTGVTVAAVATAVNGEVTFNVYNEGVAYYAVRVKHFGDDLTPWDVSFLGANADTKNTSDSYGVGVDAEKNYLGRYGVLRNNWYEIKINSITKFGEPTVGDLPLDGTPDDKKEPQQAISCDVNILSWAKRSQSEDL